MRRFAIVSLLALAALIARAAGEAPRSDEKPAAGRKLYVSKCARCHKFYDPTAYDDKKWRQWMGKMRDKARLSDEQYKQLSEYLQSVRAEAVQKTTARTKP